MIPKVSFSGTFPTSDNMRRPPSHTSAPASTGVATTVSSVKKKKKSHWILWTAAVTTAVAVGLAVINRKTSLFKLKGAEAEGFVEKFIKRPLEATANFIDDKIWGGIKSLSSKIIKHDAKEPGGAA